MHKELLSIRDLKTYFYTSQGVVKAVDGVNLDIREGETVGLIGETGCGKSQTALSILRLIRHPGKIISGRIVLEGQDLLKLKEKEMRRIRGRKISIIFQDPSTSLNPLLTVGYQIAESLKLHLMVNKSETDKEVEKRLDWTGIADPARGRKSYPHEFSMGMRQRAMSAISISCKPKLLIADEPTSNLDATIQAQILDLLRRLKKEHDFAILLITHNVGVVAEMCDRVAVMYAGRIVEVADVEDFFREPKHPYSSLLLRALPVIGAYSEKLAEIPGNVPDLTNLPPGCRFHPRCPYVMNACKTLDPKMVTNDRGHGVACQLYADSS